MRTIVRGTDQCLVIVTVKPPLNTFEKLRRHVQHARDLPGFGVGTTVGGVAGRACCFYRQVFQGLVPQRTRVSFGKGGGQGAAFDEGTHCIALAPRHEFDVEPRSTKQCACFIVDFEPAVIAIGGSVKGIGYAPFSGHEKHRDCP